DISQQADCARGDERGDEEGSNLIDPVPPGKHDDEPSDDNGDRTEQVSQHLEVGAAYVDTLLLPRLQDQEGDQVSHRTDDRCYKHRSCLDLYLGSDAPDRIDDDNDTDDAEDDAIEHRGE